MTTLKPKTHQTLIEIETARESVVSLTQEDKEFLQNKAP